MVDGRPRRGGRLRRRCERLAASRPAPAVQRCAHTCGGDGWDPASKGRARPGARAVQHPEFECGQQRGAEVWWRMGGLVPGGGRREGCRCGASCAEGSLALRRLRWASRAVGSEGGISCCWQHAQPHHSHEQLATNNVPTGVLIGTGTCKARLAQVHRLDRLTRSRLVWLRRQVECPASTGARVPWGRVAEAGCPAYAGHRALGGSRSSRPPAPRTAPCAAVHCSPRTVFTTCAPGPTIRQRP